MSEILKFIEFLTLVLASTLFFAYFLIPTFILVIVLNPSYKNSTNYPDIELVLGSGSLTGDTSGSMRELLGLTQQFDNEVFADYKGRDGFSIVPVLMRPKSRGRVMLRNSNPFAFPKLYANYYSRQEDVDTMVRGIKAVSWQSFFFFF